MESFGPADSGRGEYRREVTKRRVRPLVARYMERDNWSLPGATSPAYSQPQLFDPEHLSIFQPRCRGFFFCMPGNMNCDDKRLLIIDDDENYRAILARSLKRHQFSAATAATIEEGLSISRLHDPEYILLDLNLAGQSGLAMIQPLLEIAPGARIVILTGYASIQTAVGAMKLGACHYLPKPANVTDIVKALLGEDFSIPQTPDEERMTVQHMEWEYIKGALAEHAGNIAATARSLRMHRRTLQRKLAKRRPAETR